MKNLHSFGLLAYKNSPYLEDCLNSLKQQSSLSNIYITTSTPSAFIEDIAKKYNIPLFVNKEPSNIADDWSFAYRMCKTPYVTLAHQDDIYHPTYTEQCLMTLKNHPDCLICFTDYQEYHHDKLISFSLKLLIKKLMLFILTQKLDTPFRKRLLLSFGNPICCPSVTFNKAKIGNFSFNNNFKVALDWEAWLCLADMEGCFKYLNQPLIIHRLHQDSATTQGIQNRLRQKEDNLLLESLWPKPLAKLLAFFYAFGQKDI